MKMTNLTVSNLTLLLSGALVVIALLIANKEKLHLTKDIAISVIRVIVQLTIIGYVLKYLFKLNNIWFTILMVLIICFNAAYNANKRNKTLTGIFKISFIAIFTGMFTTLTILLLSGSIQPIPAQVIPISGMIASNSMVAVGLCYRHMNSTFYDQQQQIQEKLALGATLKQASTNIIRESIKTGMSPTIESTRTLGIVSLPGMMSGLMFAGVDPVHAIKYQIMVVFMLLATTSLASFIACYGTYKYYFTDRMQLRLNLFSSENED